MIKIFGKILTMIGDVPSSIIRWIGAGKAMQQAKKANENAGKDVPRQDNHHKLIACDQ